MIRIPKLVSFYLSYNRHLLVGYHASWRNAGSQAHRLLKKKWLKVAAVCSSVAYMWPTLHYFLSSMLSDKMAWQAQACPCLPVQHLLFNSGEVEVAKEIHSCMIKSGHNT